MPVTICDREPKQSNMSKEGSVAAQALKRVQDDRKEKEAKSLWVAQTSLSDL